MAETIEDSTRASLINRLILRYSVDGNLWSKAVDHQQRIRKEAEEESDEEKILESLSDLARLYLRGGQLDKAASTKEEYIALLRKVEKGPLLAASYEELATIYERARRYSEASVWAESAYNHYTNLEDAIGQARAILLQGRIELQADNKL